MIRRLLATCALLTIPASGWAVPIYQVEFNLINPVDNGSFEFSDGGAYGDHRI